MNTAAKIVHSPRVTTTASAYCDPSEHLYAPLSLVFSVPRTTREQWVALLTPVVVYLRSVAVHAGPLILVALYDHNISDELDAHSRMSGSSRSPMAFCGALISAPDAATTTSVVNMFSENTCCTEKQYSSKWHAWFDSRCPGRRLSTWPTTGVSCPTALGALCGQLTFRLAWCRQHSAVMVTELLQPRDLACGTPFQSSCVILTSPRPTDCSDDSWRDAFFGKHEHGALWLLGRHRKHMQQAQLVQKKHQKVAEGHQIWRCSTLYHYHRKSKNRIFFSTHATCFSASPCKTENTKAVSFLLKCWVLLC